ncbi:MAG: CoA transferase, partial [Ferrovibrionaceae bacterium]
MTGESQKAQPLSGIKVIDFTQVMMGPCATQMLADYGADVIKIERAGAGDLSRTSIADDPDGLDNPVFRSLNRNKRSIALDVRGPEGKAVIYELVRTADVVVNNFRAGVMERMGFGYEALSKINPRIICAFGSGFGQT